MCLPLRCNSGVLDKKRKPGYVRVCLHMAPNNADTVSGPDRTSSSGTWTRPLTLH